MVEIKQGSDDVKQQNIQEAYRILNKGVSLHNLQKY